MKKRTICLLLAMIMVLSIVLVGCSKTAETPAANPPPRLSRRKPPTTPKPLKLPKRLPSPRLSRRPFSS